MGFNITGRTPVNGATQDPGTVTLSVSYNMTGGAYIWQHKIDWRRNGGSWNTVTSNTPLYGAGSYTASVGMDSNDLIEWYMTAYWVDAGGSYHINLDGGPSAVWSVTPTPDTTAPTITSVTPAAGNATPGGAGVTFQASVTDNNSVAEVKLYVDGALEYTWTTSGTKALTKALTKKLTLGAHTYRWTAKDREGNTADTGTVNITIINGAPEVPSGAITVAGQTGAVSVANLGAVALSWPAFLDGNPEDSLTYTLENRAAGGAWAEVATGITSPAYEWSPNIGLGAAELRVKANDGTVDSAYLTRTGITIVSSQSPNAPTLTSPLGGETWREGETHNVTWTPAATEHPEGLPCTYEIQFSALGDFSDAVTITTTADDGSYPWTLSTDLV